MVAENEPAMVEAANAVYSMNDEYWIRKRCRDRMDYERSMVYLNQERDKYKALWEESTAELEELNASLSDKDQLIASLQMELKRLNNK